jgi:hypothetical protein
MKRRTAIGRILAAGVGGGLVFSGYKWHDWHKAPDLGFVTLQKELLAALAETIIPATDTPGARDAGVADFIIAMIKDCTEIKTQNKFIDGLKELRSYSLSKYQKEYQRCDPQEQRTILQHFEQEGKPFRGILGKAQNRFLGKSFFSTLKQYTVEGYCTSERGASMGLTYLAVPGSFRGCLPMSPGQKAWATK